MYKCSKFSESEINSLPSDVLERYEKLKEMSEDFADDKEMYEVLQKNDNALAEIIKKHISNHKSSSSTATQEAEEAEEEVAETESKPQKTRVKKEPKPKVKKEPKQKAERKPKVKKEPKQKAERKPKVKKVKKVKPKAEKKIKKPESKAEPKNQVDSIPKSIAVLRSYLTLNGKEVTAKRLFSTYAGAAKAINDGLIRKTDKYADQIRAMLKNIRKHYAGLKKGDDITKFSIPNVEALKKTVSKYMVKPDMAAVKSFLNFYSKKQKTPKETANRLLTRIKKLPKSKVMGQAARSVEQFLDNGQWGYLLPSELKGLAGLAGISFDGLKKKIDKSTMQPSPISGIDPAQTETSTVPITGDGSINTTDLNKVIFETFDLPGQFKTFIGKASSPFHMMIYGEKGSGKSSLAIQLAKALAIGLNMKVKYIAKEEGLNYTIQEKMQRLNAIHPNIEINPGNLPLNELDFSTTNVVFIDSVNEMNLQPTDIKALQERYPNLSIVAIFKARKDGRYLGETDWQHLFQVVVNVEQGIANTNEKNRFGGVGTLEVF